MPNNYVYGMPGYQAMMDELWELIGEFGGVLNASADVQKFVRHWWEWAVEQR